MLIECFVCVLGGEWKREGGLTKEDRWLSLAICFLVFSIVSFAKYMHAPFTNRFCLDSMDALLVTFCCDYESNLMTCCMWGSIGDAHIDVYTSISFFLSNWIFTWHYRMAESTFAWIGSDIYLNKTWSVGFLSQK